MSLTMMLKHNPTEPLPDSGRWRALADRVLDGQRLTAEEGLAILRSGEGEILEILSGAYRVR